MRQYGHDAEQAPVLIVTHKTTRAAIDQILEDFAKTRVVEGQPVALRIEAVLPGQARHARWLCGAVAQNDTSVSAHSLATARTAALGRRNQ